MMMQGTMPSNTNQPSQEPMWRGMIISCPIIAACFFPIAIAGYWAYGNPYGTMVSGICLCYIFSRAEDFVVTWIV